jgi:uncharacterized repeat protein (TIGR03803 family)
MLCLCAAVSAQQATSAPNHKELMIQRPVAPLHVESFVSGVIRNSAIAPPSAATPAETPTEVVLHNFASPPHGAYPATGVIRDSAGNFYGTTNGAYSDIGGGGTEDAGVVFKVDPSGNQTVLYSFRGGADGSWPNGLVRDPDGNLYGTTNYGGASGAGVLFKLDRSGKETVLYTFTGGADGANPNSVVLDWRGDLYGTTSNGGASGAVSRSGSINQVARRRYTPLRAGATGHIPIRM